MRQRLIKASVPTDFSSDILEVNANDLSNEVFQSISTNKNILNESADIQAKFNKNSYYLHMPLLTATFFTASATLSTTLLSKTSGII